jgi:hypothetical protein
MRLQKRWLYAGLLLLLMACPPMSASANSSGDSYHPAMPSIESRGLETAPEATAPPKGHPDPKPKAGEGAPTETTAVPEGEPESEERHRAHAVTPGDGGGHPPKGGGGHKESVSPQASARPGSTGQTPEKTPTRAVGAEGGGGSSPVVPILIAMAVLAALSIGTVLYRGRRQDPRQAA